MTEVVIRPNDTIDELKRKIRIATILGTLQATLTDFRYLRKVWKRNAEEERLLGVSMTGIMDHPTLSHYSQGEGNRTLGSILKDMKEVAIEVNKEWAEKLEINQSAAIHTLKPSGTVSQLVDSASGIHPRFSPYYLRTVRADKKDPLADFMIDKGFYHEEDAMNPSNWVFYFPMKSPDGAITANDFGCMDQLAIWKEYQDSWCEHKPSMTAYYRDDEFLKVGQWVWDNIESISGVSFLPYVEHSYVQAPYQEIDKETYERWVESMPKNVDWEEMASYEEGDNTEGSQELACSSGGCAI